MAAECSRIGHSVSNLRDGLLDQDLIEFRIYMQGWLIDIPATNHNIVCTKLLYLIEACSIKCMFNDIRMYERRSV